LDELVALISARVEAGEPIDLAALTADCPQFRERLEMLLPTLQAVAELDHSFAHVGESPDPAHPTPGSPPFHGSESRRGDEGLGEGSSAATGLLGDFRILREVGRGGMGVVYEAEQISLGRRVALKVLPFAAMLDRQQLARFKNEARAAATLDHPNIVAIYSVGAERGVHYYAMQLIEGQSLAEIIAAMRQKSGVEEQRSSGVEEQRSRGVVEQKLKTEPTPLLHYSTTALPKSTPPLHSSSGNTVPVARLTTLPAFDSREYFRAIAQLGIQAAEALDHAHQNGILHRDIKPANLLVDDAGKLWITDFGLARMEQDAGMTMTGDLLGTLRYMSPEQALAKRVVVDHRSDIYSLGVTLYELLTLQPAFTGDDRQELLRQIAFEEPRKPRQVNSRIPQDLETVILKSIEKEASDRYATAHELADDLLRFLENKPLVARPLSLAQRARRWTMRHSGIFVAASAILLIAAVISGIAAALIAQERATAQRSAKQSDDNLQLALETLHDTLSAYVVGDLLGDNRLDDQQRELIRRGIAFYEKFAQRNDLDLSDNVTYQNLLGANYLEQAYEFEARSLHAKAEQAYQKAIFQAQQIVALSEHDSSIRAKDTSNPWFGLANSHNAYATLLGDMGNFDGAFQHLLEARAIYEDRQRIPDADAVDYSLGSNYYNMGNIELAAGDRAAAEASYRDALPLLGQAVKREFQRGKFRHVLAMCQYNLGHLLGSTKRGDEAEQIWRQSLNNWRILVANYSTVSEYHSRVGATLNNLGALALMEGEFAEARPLLEEALVHQKRALARQPVYDGAYSFLSQHYKALAKVLGELGDKVALAALEVDKEKWLGVLSEAQPAAPAETTEP
jgi:serine/threonine protein kinase